MKKLLAMILALTLCLGGAALAGSEGPLFEAKYISTLIYNGIPDVLRYTNFKNGEGIVTIQGEKLCEDGFGKLSEVGHGYFEAINQNGLDTHGLVDRNGNEVIPFQYSAFQAYSAQWVGAVSLVETTDEHGDYSGGYFGSGDQYNIDHVDMYYIPEQKMAGTLSREQFQEGRGVGGGEYLLVKDRNGGLTMYNSAFETVDHLFERIDDAELCVYQPDALKAATLNSRVTCEVVSEEVPDRVSTIYDSDDYCAASKSVKVDFKDTQRSALFANDGRQVTDYVLGDVQRVCNGRYVISYIYDSEASKTLYGVYDLEKGAEVFPFAYDQVISDNKLTGLNGYFCVKLDDKLGFVNSEGAVSCPIDYLNDNVDKRMGCCFVYKDGDQLLLVAGDGFVTNLTEKGIESVSYGQTGSDGQFVVVKNAEGKYGVLDWHGNGVVDFVLDSMPNIYQDGYMEYDGAIYHLTMD